MKSKKMVVGEGVVFCIIGQLQANINTLYSDDIKDYARANDDNFCGHDHDNGDVTDDYDHDHDGADDNVHDDDGADDDADDNPNESTIGISDPSATHFNEG